MLFLLVAGSVASTNGQTRSLGYVVSPSEAEFCMPYGISIQFYSQAQGFYGSLKLEAATPDSWAEKIHVSSTVGVPCRVTRVALYGSNLEISLDYDGEDKDIHNGAISVNIGKGIVSKQSQTSAGTEIHEESPEINLTYEYRSEITENLQALKTCGTGNEAVGSAEDVVVKEGNMIVSRGSKMNSYGEITFSPVIEARGFYDIIIPAGFYIKSYEDNEPVYNQPEVHRVYVVGTPFRTVNVFPAPGSVLESLGNFLFTFPDDIYGINYSKGDITIKNDKTNVTYNWIRSGAQQVEGYYEVRFPEITEPGEYTMRVPTALWKSDYYSTFANTEMVYHFTVSDASGINDVFTDSEEVATPEYYTISGIKLDKMPDRGIFIEKTGSKTRKIVL